MTASELADLIDVMATSIRSEPTQFQVSLMLVGQSIVSNGGTGLTVNVTGGAAGSTTIGNKVSVGGSSVEIRRQQGQQAEQAFMQQIEALSAHLASMATELRSPTPNRGMLQAMLESLKNTWVPGVIIGLLGNGLSKLAGI